MNLEVCYPKKNPVKLLSSCQTIPGRFKNKTPEVQYKIG